MTIAQMHIDFNVALREILGGNLPEVSVDIDDDSISILSPVGQAIYGLSVGDKASADIPRGQFNFEVVEISKSDVE